MFRTHLTAVFFMLCLLTPIAENVHAVQIDKPAPGFSLYDPDGRRHQLADFKGSVVILNFWSTSCAPCVAEMPGLNSLHSELKDSGLTVLGISLDRSAKAVKELASRLRISYPLLMDSRQEVYFDSYALFGQPVSILIDRQGMVRDRLTGQIDWNAPSIRSKVMNLLKGK